MFYALSQRTKFDYHSGGDPKKISVGPDLDKAIHFPGLAEETTGAAFLRTFTLMMCHP
jgi:hypothetical protein